MRLNRMKKDTGYRFTKQELILRVFAFYDSYKEYKILEIDVNITMSDTNQEINLKFDYKSDLYAVLFCSNQIELHSILKTLQKEEFIYDEGVLFLDRFFCL